MGRKGIKPKLLMCAVALSTMVTGILGSAPLPVKAAEEENYTVTFEAYEGTCETESISVPRGESLMLPEAVYEGHYLESWMDITNNEGVTKFTAVGKAGDTYTPERDLWLYANWKQETGSEAGSEPEAEPKAEPEEELEAETGLEEETELETETETEKELEAETGLEEEPEQETESKAEGELEMGSEEETEEKADISYEARIGENYYEDIESAFANAQAGDTVIVLKDCKVSKTLEVTADNITLKSEDAGNPVTISREEEFTGKKYAKDAGNVLVGISSGSLTTQDIILDGGAVLDEDFNNSGQVWDSPLIYVKGSYAMEAGTVLQNNYNTDYSESVDSSRSVRTAGAVDVAWDAGMTMNGGLIQDCYTLGAGGGIQSSKTAEVTLTSGTIRHCGAVWGGALGLMGPSEASDMVLSGNHSSSTGGAVWSTLSMAMTDCIIEGNSSGYDGGGVFMSTGTQAKLIRCTLTGNTAPRGSAIQTGKGEGTQALIIRDCTITGNRSMEKISMGSAICYMNETGIVLDGKIVMEDNHEVGLAPCDIFYFYNEGASILLDEL